MPDLWIPGFQRLAPRGNSNSMHRNNASRKVTHHTTEAPSGHTKSGNSYFDAMHRVLRDAKSEPTFLIDPLTDEAGQYFPIDRAARALKGVNRDGTINVQVEWVAYAGKPFTDYWQPGPNVRAFFQAMLEWGIPAEFPGGPLMRSYGDPRTSRSATNWRKSGHFGHCQAPGNSHWDPGDIDTIALLAAGKPLPEITPEPEKEWDEMATPEQVGAAVGGRVNDALEAHLKTVKADLAQTKKDAAQSARLNAEIIRSLRVMDNRINVGLRNAAGARLTEAKVRSVMDGLNLPATTVDLAAKRLHTLLLDAVEEHAGDEDDVAAEPAKEA